ncbi:stellacyanin-like [Abrus precatorius]|uniref:Stellacyanin-like n=1 Tax=Abrus precatorius TaxID=3816 RepID=A0A8B8KIU5_ABRPR|nr:stellacyanin-like [Abrus precatorius]
MAVKMHLSLFIFATIGCIMLVSVSSTTTHVVGDNFGWNMPSYPGFFEDWAKKRTFSVGDVLLFQYNAGLNTVVEVNKEDYGNCTTRNTLNSFFEGDSSFILRRAGDYYFLSSVGKHCEAGLKLWVNVHQ